MHYKISDLFSLFQRMSIVLLLGAGLASCGSSSSGGGTTTLSGTAATGIAIDGVVNVYGSNGGSILDVDIDASGNYTADVSGLTAPFFVCAEPTNVSLDSQYSFAAGAGTTNITPMTTLTLYYANGGTDPSTLATTWPAAAATVQAAVADAQAVVNANFVGVFSLVDSNLDTDFTTFDFFSTSFAIGDVIDQILDYLSVDLSGGTPVIMVDGNPIMFNPSIDITGIDIGGSGGNPIGSGTSTTIFGGNGLIELPSLPGNAFTPDAYLANAGTLTWADTVNDIIIVMIVNPADAAEIISVTVSNDTSGGGVTWNTTDLNGIQDVTYNGTTVTMVGLGLLPLSAGPGSLIMNGTLAP